MDKSEQYAEMRLAAIPDLGMGIPPQKPTHFYTETIWVDAKGDFYYSTADKVVQLERQDQLQEMIGKDPLTKAIDPYSNMKNAMWSVLDDLHTYGFTPNIFNKFIPVTMEQLWLAFVMRGKYGKAWDGEKWLTI